MSARVLPLLTTGVVVLLIAGCSGGGGSAASEPSGTTSAPPPSTTSAAPTSTPTSTQRSTSAKPADGAVARYETFMHAVGRQDLTTACEIAGPAAKKAEDQGFGPCEQTFPITFQMISATQKRALQSATVDRARITQDSPTKVEIPATAVRAAVKFTDEDLGDATLEYRGGQWYVTD